MLVGGYYAHGVVEEFFDMVFADILRMIAECRDAGMDLLGPFLMSFEFWERLEFGFRGVVARGVAVLPFVNVGSSARGSGVEYNTPAICR